MPALRIVPPYYRHPAYLEAVTQVITDDLAKLPWRPDHYLLSFHGIPIRYAKARRSLCHPRQAHHASAGHPARLAARAMDADVSIAVRPRGLAQAIHR